jgi:hypothetical protein
MKRARQLAALLAVMVLSSSLRAQQPPSPSPPAAPANSPAAPADSNPWAYSLTVDGYVEQGYASPVFTADHNWLHLEARYNYEDQRTASLWAGYNFTAGKKLQLTLTPMIGGVFGQTDGIAPGLELSLTYWKLAFSSASEYVVGTGKTADSFFYSWPELTYSPVSWFRIGGVAQHTKAYRTTLDTQRGFLIGVSIKKLQFTTYVFDPDLPTPTTVLEMGYSF